MLNLQPQEKPIQQSSIYGSIGTLEEFKLAENWNIYGERYNEHTDDRVSQTSPFLPNDITANGKYTILPNQQIPNGKDAAHIPITSTNTKLCSGLMAQCLVTFVVIMVVVGCGMPIGFSAILLPQLQSENSTLPITENEGSWIASIHSAATPIGGLISGLLMDRVGRKRCLCICLCPIFFGWILISMSKDFMMIIIGRFLAGITVGASGAPAQIIISEISEPHLRGILSTVPFAGYAFGILLMYVIGSLFEWHTAAILSIIIPVLSLVLICFVPDTPIWLIRNGKLKEATRYLYWLRDNNTEAQKELQQLMSRIHTEENENNNYTTSGTFIGVKKESLCKILKKPQVWKPFSIIFIFALGQNFSGCYIVIFYAVDIIAEMGVHVDSEFTAIMTAVIRLLFVIISIFLIASIGRRPLALLSTISSGICGLALGIILIAKNSFDMSPYDLYLVIIFLMIYIAGTTVGIMPLFGILIGELSPAKWRGFISGISFGLFNSILFICIKFFPFMKYSIGISGMFIFFGTFCLLSALYFYLFLPETKNKSLSEIEDHFIENRYLWIRRNH